MSFQPFTSLTSRTIVLSAENIDTDQIIPARFLTTTTSQGLGRFVFHDWRYDEQGKLRADNPLEPARSGTHSVLIAGANFGCGSSREHAPWALKDFGFKAVVSSDIADIFKSNALKNGLLPVEVDEAIHHELLARPGDTVTIDLKSQTVSFQDMRGSFWVEPFARKSLLEGVDPLGHLLNQEEAITAFEAGRT